MVKRWGWLCSLMFCCIATVPVWGGGSGLNVVVVVNQASTNSVQLGNYYSEKRQVPPQNFLRINWPGGNTMWTDVEFSTNLLSPFLSLLSNRQLTNQIEYVVLSMDIPIQILGSNDISSTTAALFYGFKTNGSVTCPVPLPPAYTSNSYAGSEGIFRSTPPVNPSSNSFLVTMITGTSLANAKMVVDQGVLGDATFPTQTVYLVKSTDLGRNVRFQLFDNAIFDTRLRQDFALQRTNVDYDWNLGTCFGLQSGVQNSSVSPTAFLPGAMADNLTSYGGLIFQNAGHLNILRFLEAGAAGTYGTVTEPCNYLAKFPTTENYFYQNRGFSLAECYYQSVTNPYQGLLLGEPLSAPFAQPASGAWNNLISNSLLSGTTNLALHFTSNDPRRPLQQVDLFLDGLWLQTLTNIPPYTNNILYVTLNGFTTNYTVPGGASIKSVTSNLTARLNAASYSNLTQVIGFAHGDRIELQSLVRSNAGAQVTLSTSNSIGTGTALTTRISASGGTFLDTLASGIRGFQITGNALNGSFLQIVVTKTNGTQVSLGVTNSPGFKLGDLAQRLVDKINTNSSPGLQDLDGLFAGDLGTNSIGTMSNAEFNVFANGPGWDAAQIQADLNGSAVFTITPAGNSRLDQNVSDLRPRNHLYVTAGFTNLPLTFAFNSANFPDGYHELTAVAYEGSHVRTQARTTQQVRIQNTSLSAAFTTLFGGSNTVVGAALQFSVVANTNNISKIELFSTGGSLTNVTGVSNTVFSIPGANLGIGLHPFYAIVSGTNGKQYRTKTTWIRLIGDEPPFSLSITAPQPVLAWPATAGRHYNILSAINPTDTFLLRDGLTPSNSAVQWAETNPGASQRFYRVQTTN